MFAKIFKLSKIFSSPLELNDLKETDNELFYSLNWLRKNSKNIENLDLTFCVTEELAGEVSLYFRERRNVL